MAAERGRPQLEGADLKSADGEILKALSFRTQVAVLWVAVAVALSGSMVLYLYVPGAVEEMLAGRAEGEILDDAVGFWLAAFVIIPLAMAAVALLISDRVYRHVNLIAGLAYGLYGLYIVIREILGGHFDGHILMTVVACALALVIVVLSWIGIRRPADRTRRT